MAKKILLADDSVTIQKVISITLANEDYELIVVGDGDAAVARINEIKPDLVMVDVAMPGKTGYEVCEIVKNDPSLRNIPVLLLAGTFEPLNMAEAERVRADENITKPFESHELLDKIRYLLSKSRWLEAEGKPAEKEEEFVSPSAVYEEAQPKVEISEDIWESGGFLGFSEDTEKTLESKPEPASDLSFLEEEIFEHRHDLEEGKFADFRLGTEETGRGQAPSPPLHEFSFGEEEERKEPSEAAGAPFDLETFMAEPPKEKPPAYEPPARAQARPVELIEELSLSEEPYSFPEERFKTESFEAPKAQEPAKAPAAAEGFDFGALRAEGFEPEARPHEVPAEEFFDLGKEPFEVSAALEKTPWPAALAPPLTAPEKAWMEAPVEQAAPHEIKPEEPEKMESIEGPPQAVEHVEPKVSFEAVEPLKEVVYEPEPHARRVAAEISERAEERLIEEAAARLEGRIEVPREEVREVVAKMAREIIQEVAWEVVPDLAEEIIRAEIDRIKHALLKLQ